MFCFTFFYIGESFAQCVNADFSQGNFNGWTGSTGENIMGVYTNIVPGIVAGTPNSNPSNLGRQTIMNVPGTDHNTGGALSVLPPGGTSSCRLGNELVAYDINTSAPREAERIQYVLPVTATNCLFTYQYAVVLQDPGSSHSNANRPKLTIYVLDATGAIVDSICGMYEVIASSTLTGFNTCPPDPGVYSPTANVVWKDWEPVVIDLSPYINNNVTIQFTTYDCGMGAHFGYVYIACSCGNLQLTQMCSGTSTVVSAPVGFGSYLWSPGGQTTSSITIPNPVAGSVVTCVCTSVTGCPVTLQITLQQFIVPVITVNSPTICPGSSATITATSAGTNTYVWNTGQSTQSITVSPPANTTYTVTATSSDGCTNSAQSVVTVDLLNASITNIVDETCSRSNGEATVTVSSGTPPYTYHWSCFPPQYNQTMTGVHAGTYNVTVTDANNCSAVYPVTIINSPPPTTSVISTPEICSHSDGTVTVTASGGSGTYTYNWNTNPPQTTQTATNLPSGIYTVIVDDGICTASGSINVTNIPGPTAYFICYPKVLTIMDGPVSFEDESYSNIVNWAWTLGDGSTATNVTTFDHQYMNVGTYPVTLIVTDTNGCKDTAEDVIIVKDIFTIYIPNCFTPNDDGFNDYFFPKGINWDPDFFDFYIFDRWGNMIYETHTIGDTWNGTVFNKGTQDDMVIDVYVYLIRVKELEGPKHEYIGRVTLVR